MPTIGVDGEHRVAKKKNLNTVIAKPAHMGSGFQHQAGAGPPRCRGSATPWLACPYGGGGTQCKGLLSQQMASQVGHYHPKFEGGKVVSAVVMPPQAHRELQGKQNKTKQRISLIHLHSPLPLLTTTPTPTTLPPATPSEDHPHKTNTTN